MTEGHEITNQVLILPIIGDIDNIYTSDDTLIIIITIIIVVVCNTNRKRKT